MWAVSTLVFVSFGLPDKHLNANLNTCRLVREKKKEQERDELWKQLEELRLRNTTLVHNKSHGLLSVQNNNNNSNNNNSDTKDKSPDAAAAAATAVTTGNNNDAEDHVAATESTSCAKWQRTSVFLLLLFHNVVVKTEDQQRHENTNYTSAVY